MRGSNVVKALLRGVMRANAKYERWSNGLWLTDSGVEGLLVASLSEELSKILAKGESLLIEVGFEHIQEWSEAARPRGRPPRVLTGQRRADIVLLDRRDRPTYVVEAKRYWSRRRGFRDIRRLRALLRTCGQENGGSLQGGLLVLFLSSEARTRREARRDIQDQVERIQREVQEEFALAPGDAEFQRSTCRYYPQRYGGEIEYASAALCIVFGA